MHMGDYSSACRLVMACNNVSKMGAMWFIGCSIYMTGQATRSAGQKRRWSEGRAPGRMHQHGDVQLRLPPGHGPQQRVQGHSWDWVQHLHLTGVLGMPAGEGQAPFSIHMETCSSACYLVMT